MVLCLFIYFLVLNFDWSIILIRKSFGASRHISGKLGSEIGYSQVSVYRTIGPTLVSSSKRKSVESSIM